MEFVLFFCQAWLLIWINAEFQGLCFPPRIMERFALRFLTYLVLQKRYPAQISFAGNLFSLCFVLTRSYSIFSFSLVLGIQTSNRCVPRCMAVSVFCSIDSSLSSEVFSIIFKITSFIAFVLYPSWIHVIHHQSSWICLSCLIGFSLIFFRFKKKKPFSIYCVIFSLTRIDTKDVLEK